MNEIHPLDLSNPEAIAKAVQDNGGQPIAIQLYFLHGIFGEMENCNGFAEEIIDTEEKLVKYGLDPAEGGTFMKLIGCSYLYKGNPEEARVFGMEQAKDMVSTIPRDIVGTSILLSGALGLLFLFARKWLVYYAHLYFEGIRWKTIRHTSPPAIRLNAMIKEIRRAMDAALKTELKIDADYDLYANTPPKRKDIKFTKFALAGLITKIVAFFTLIMQMDGAYRFRPQDGLGEIDKDNVRRAGAQELLRILKIMESREDPVTGVANKWRFIRRVLRIIFFLSPRSRRIVKNFLLELDIDKVKLDDADWYFCLRRNSYNFRGMPIADRLKELERIDTERGHQYVKIEYRKA